MQHFAPFAVAIAFWLFVAAAAVTGIIADYKKRQAAIEPVRIAVERGHPIDAAVVEQLMAPEQKADGPNPLYLRVGGIIVMSAGIGLGVLSWFIGDTEMFVRPVLGAGLLVVCVGIGLMLAARAVERHAGNPAPRPS
jgi:hypothetical protein